MVPPLAVLAPRAAGRRLLPRVCQTYVQRESKVEPSGVKVRVYIMSLLAIGRTRGWLWRKDMGGSGGRELPGRSRWPFRKLVAGWDSCRATAAQGLCSNLPGRALSAHHVAEGRVLTPLSPELGASSEASNDILFRRVGSLASFSSRFFWPSDCSPRMDPRGSGFLNSGRAMPAGLTRPPFIIPPPSTRSRAPPEKPAMLL